MYTNKARLVFVISFLSLLFVGSGIIAIVSLSSTNNSPRTIHDDRLITIGQLNTIFRLIGDNRMAIAEFMNGDSAFVTKTTDAVDKRVAEVDRAWNAFNATEMSELERTQAMKAMESRTKFAEEGLKPTVAALHAANIPQAMEVVQGPISQLYAVFQADIDALVKTQEDVANKEYEKTQSMYVMVRNMSIAAMLFSVMLAGLIGVWYRRPRLLRLYRCSSLVRQSRSPCCLCRSLWQLRCRR